MTTAGVDGVSDNTSTYDYVIIGGGSAGCVLANRLSADPEISVCVLEAGPSDWHPAIHVPLGVIALMRSRLVNWRYYTAPQQHLNGRRLYWPRGRTLGGSSSINAQCYTRGHPADYDHWAALGNRGWGYRDMLAYFRRSECFADGENAFHGGLGGYHVDRGRYTNPLDEVFVKAAIHAGHPANDDFSGDCCVGVGRYHVAQRNGRRCSNADAFLTPIRGRANLTIITGARATRVLFDGRRAVGARYVRGWRRRSAVIGARREVLLAGGAINSPQLLLCSGIGPAAELDRHAIRMVHDLPGVGANLQDHLDISVIELERTRLSLRLDASFWLWQAPKVLCDYLVRRRGLLTSNVAGSGGFISCAEPGEARPDLQIHFIATIEQDHGLNLKNTIAYHGYTLRICQLHPHSRGRIRLTSADPLAPPHIDPGYLSDSRDLDALVGAVKVARRILRSAPIVDHRERELEPGDDCIDDADIRDYIRRRAETIYHPVGSCAMGDGPQAVVDDRLRVHGVDGLRVVDASIMPTIVGGNTNAPTTAIAEKAADMIQADAR